MRQPGYINCHVAKEKGRSPHKELEFGGARPSVGALDRFGWTQGGKTLAGVQDRQRIRDPDEGDEAQTGEVERRIQRTVRQRRSRTRVASLGLVTRSTGDRAIRTNR